MILLTIGSSFYLEISSLNKGNSPCIDDDDEWVRDVAARGIGNIWRFRKISETRHEVIGSEELVSDVVESLIGCLSDDDSEVRASSARALPMESRYCLPLCRQPRRCGVST